MKNLQQQRRVRETQGHRRRVTQKTSHIQRQLERASISQKRHTSKKRSAFFGEVRTHLAVTEGEQEEPKNVCKPKRGADWHKWHQGMDDNVNGLQDNEVLDLVRQPTDRDVKTEKWFYKMKNLDLMVKSAFLKHAFRQTFSNKGNAWTVLRLLRQPVSYSGLQAYQ